MCSKEEHKSWSLSMSVSAIIIWSSVALRVFGRVSIFKSGFVDLDLNPRIWIWIWSFLKWVDLDLSFFGRVDLYLKVWPDLDLNLAGFAHLCEQLIGCWYSTPLFSEGKTMTLQFIWAGKLFCHKTGEMVILPLAVMVLLQKLQKFWSSAGIYCTLAWHHLNCSRTT